MTAFVDLLNELAVLEAKKRCDYGADGDPYANVRASEEFGIPAWVGCMVRANDKLTRIKTMAHRGKLVNEPLEDSLKDLAVYALIAVLLLREREGLPPAGIGALIDAPSVVGGARPAAETPNRD